MGVKWPGDMREGLGEWEAGIEYKRQEVCGGLEGLEERA